MATFDQIKDVRLTISDPSGFINFVQVANQAALPSPHVDQTAYNTLDTGSYWWYNGAAWEVLQLYVSDESISTWIDTFGVEGATRKAVERLLATLPSRFQILRNKDGAEETEFISLNELAKFWRDYLKNLTPVDQTVNTARMGSARRPCIAGGDV